MRVVGSDVSRTVAEIAYLVDGKVKSGGRVEMVQSVLARWAAAQWRASDHVVLEATGNKTAVVNAVRGHAARVVVANPFQVRLIAEARVKTDKIDAAVLAQLRRAASFPKCGFRMMRHRHSVDRSRGARRSCASGYASRTKCIRCCNMYVIPRCPAAISLVARAASGWPMTCPSKSGSVSSNGFANSIGSART